MSENELLDDAMILDEDYDDEETLPSEAEEENPEEDPAVRTERLAALEALLFLTGDDGLTVGQAAEAMELEAEEVTGLFDELIQNYLEDTHGIEIARFGEKYRFLSKASVHEYAKRLFQISKISTLSGAALETLAIIAYRQPVTRVEIEEIRGVGADMMLRKLQARNLIREDGRSDAPGRPILYSVTDEFMDAFQLYSLDELPELPTFDEDREGNDELFNS
ncbi:MAG: SMC-Scp complex subunit ScpB [Solobacterium sp.]|nr:SMC-Scp complex subunit ScpB [Solobacterium sp.]